MRRSLLTLIVLSAVLSASATAQLGRFPASGQRPGTDDPKWWGSLWGGYQWSNPVDDGRSAARWNFDAGWGLRGTLERDLGYETSIGVAYNYVRMPLTFAGVATPGGGARCTSGCEATATIASYGLLLRNGRGRGLHPVFEGFLGAMQFNNFDFKESSQQPSVEIKNTDFAFALGTGFGYSLSRDFQLIALYEIGRNVHEPSGFQNGRRLSQHYVTRVGLRVGF